MQNEVRDHHSIIHSIMYQRCCCKWKYNSSPSLNSLLFDPLSHFLRHVYMVLLENDRVKTSRTLKSSKPRKKKHIYFLIPSTWLIVMFQICTENCHHVICRALSDSSLLLIVQSPQSREGTVRARGASRDATRDSSESGEEFTRLYVQGRKRWGFHFGCKPWVVVRFLFELPSDASKQTPRENFCSATILLMSPSPWIQLHKGVSTLSLPLFFSSEVISDIPLLTQMRLVCRVFMEPHVSGGLMWLRCRSLSLQATPTFLTTTVMSPPPFHSCIWKGTVPTFSQLRGLRRCR